jgi:hypothetical protein
MSEEEAIARAIGRLRDDVDDLRAQRREDATVSLLRSLSDEVTVTDEGIAQDTRSGADRVADYDNDSYGFGEYSV